MGLPKLKPYFTPAEYLAFERRSDVRHEYIDGQIYVMAGGSPPHNAICFNTTVAIGIQIRDTECQGYTSDQKIRTDPQDLFSYPDLTIVCGAPIFHDDHKDVILNPKVVIEVLSPTTETYDRDEKLTRYQNFKSLSDCILIAQDRPRVEHYVRQPGKRQWLFTIEIELSAVIEIASINCRLRLSDIYDRITFPPPKTLALNPLMAAAKPTKTKRKKGH